MKPQKEKQRSESLRKLFKRYATEESALMVLLRTTTGAVSIVLGIRDVLVLQSAGVRTSRFKFSE